MERTEQRVSLCELSEPLGRAHPQGVVQQLGVDPHLDQRLPLREGLPLRGDGGRQAEVVLVHDAKG